MLLQKKVQARCQDDFVYELLKAYLKKQYKHGGQARDLQRPGLFEQPRQQNPDREPTQVELDAVCALGFESYMAGFALKMARFDSQRAIEILLSNQTELIAFIEKQQIEKARKEQEELERAAKMSLVGQQAN